MRTTTKKTWGSALVLTLALAGSFAGAAAQSATVEASAAVQRADLLAEHARQLAGLERRFEEASLLLREAAELREGDAAAVGELVEAAHYAWYAGLELSALWTMYEAGKRALALGDEETAAEAYMDAAWVARETGRTRVAREILEEGLELLGTEAVAVAARTPPFVIQSW